MGNLFTQKFSPPFFATLFDLSFIRLNPKRPLISIRPARNQRINLAQNSFEIEKNAIYEKSQ